MKIVGFRTQEGLRLGVIEGDRVIDLQAVDPSVPNDLAAVLSQHNGDLEPIGDAKLRPKDTKIPIVKLGDGQAMLIYATAVLGSGRDHAKWQSTHGVGYRYYPILKAGNKSLDPLDPNVPYCESHMQSTSTEEEEVMVLSEDCETCQKFAAQYKVESVKASNDPTRIVLEFETDGSLSAKAVLLATLDILGKRFSELATQAAGLA